MKQVNSRKIALEILSDILDDGAFFEDAFEHQLKENDITPEDKKFIAMLILTTLRRLGQIDYVVSQLLEKLLPKNKPRIQNVLRLGVCQMLFMNVKSYAAVNNAVESLSKTESVFKGLVNAILRNFDREKSYLTDEIKGKELENIPQWIRDIWSNNWKRSKVKKIATKLLEEPKLDITVNKEKITDVEEYFKDYDVKILPNGTVRFLEHQDVRKIKGFEDGVWWVQDFSASIPVKIMGDVKGKRIADLCSAPGGKTSQLAANGAEVDAFDISKYRIKILESNLKRLNLKANVINEDIVEFCKNYDGEKYDAVLLDAPCSATGTVRRHPELFYIKNQKSVENQMQIQNDMLRVVGNILKDGGELIYCVCSMQKIEAEKTINDFLYNNKNWQRKELKAEELFDVKTDVKVNESIINKKGDFRALPYMLGEYGGIDGFYACRLIKTS